MNTALLEGQNLGWKLGLVLRGDARPEILSTYASERHAVAKQLIDMDRQLVCLYAGLEQQTVDNFSSDACAEWLQKLGTFQASNYAVRLVYSASKYSAPNLILL